MNFQLERWAVASFLGLPMNGMCLFSSLLSVIGILRKGMTMPSKKDECEAATKIGHSSFEASSPKIN